ncbi:type IV pilus biogenesis protein PilM [Ammoniphilus sp. CFH 90114]|uniref:type IV pilus biogenesis protein PilM n=1 Tax=Ammoniphilus sp. CFH 90114 TaxID=2493665 RepID=UPI00100FECE0|nr:pilus assembly protein PilM [Ammoniphilus sp. CFH 90114]RXT14694.1 pilus assembly protein PilM [Ammoniphilus sp. CFH 90114]
MLPKLNLQLGNKKRINLVIKDHVIRYLDSRHPDLKAVRAFGEHYLPDGLIREGKIVEMPALVDKLQGCVDEWGIKRRDVQFLVPDSFIVVRKLQIPSDIQSDEVKGYFFMELGSSIHLPFDNPIFDTVILGEKNGKKDVLLFATPENIVKDYSDLLEQVKLHPVVADISPLAIYRLYYQLGLVQQEEHALCIQFDVQTVNISIFHDHKILFMRHLRMDVDWAGWKVEKDALGVDNLKWAGDIDYIHNELLAMIAEIERVMSFYRFSMNQGKSQITRILLNGDHPLLEWIEDQILARMDVPTSSLKDEKITTLKGEHILPQHHLTLGLSLKEVK